MPRGVEDGKVTAAADFTACRSNRVAAVNSDLFTVGRGTGLGPHALQ